MLVDYLELTYKHLPFTMYPYKLTEYLCKRFDIKKGSKILDVGCGRGEYIAGFLAKDMDAYGCDLSDYSLRCFPDLLKNRFYKDSLLYLGFLFDYDVIFSKSFFEHIFNYEDMIRCMYDKTKIGGLCIAMVPDYECCMKGFYGDFDHKKPWMQSSLKELFEWTGFKDVQCEKLLTYPPLWENPWKKYLYKIGSYLPPWKNTNMVFARKGYTMLLCWGYR